MSWTSTTTATSGQRRWTSLMLQSSLGRRPSVLVVVDLIYLEKFGFCASRHSPNNIANQMHCELQLSGKQLFRCGAYVSCVCVTCHRVCTQWSAVIERLISCQSAHAIHQ